MSSHGKDGTFIRIQILLLFWMIFTNTWKVFTLGFHVTLLVPSFREGLDYYLAWHKYINKCSPCSGSFTAAEGSPVSMFCFVVLCPSNIKSHTDLWQCAVIVTLYCCPTGKPGCQHIGLISHSVTFSWRWANQSLLYPNYAERLARTWQVSISNSLVWLDQDSNPWD